jgi:dTDP-L-rhamnose 4-epimerase
VHVSDVVRANLLALERPEAAGRVYNVGTGVATNVLDVGARLARELAFEGPPDVPGRFRAGDIRHCVADVSRIRGELGYEPSVALDDGLREFLDWLRTETPEDRLEQATRELTERGLAR